jgi:hypothetical protein
VVKERMVSAQVTGVDGGKAATDALPQGLCSAGPIADWGLADCKQVQVDTELTDRHSQPVGDVRLPWEEKTDPERLP